VEDVIALRVTESDGTSVAFLTWGRLFDPVDETEIIAAVVRVLPEFGVHVFTEIAVCDNLGEVATERYFYEGLVSFASDMRDDSKDDESWRSLRRKAVISGKEIYFLGRRKA